MTKDPAGLQMVLATRGHVEEDCEWCKLGWTRIEMDGKPVHYKMTHKVMQTTNYQPTLRFHKV